MIDEIIRSMQEASAGEIMRWLLLVIFVFASIVLYALHRSKNDWRSDFDMTDLIMQNRRIDKVAFVYMVSFFALTWLLMYNGLRDKLTESFLTTYCVSVFGPIALKFLGGSAADIFGKKNGGAEKQPPVEPAAPPLTPGMQQ